MSRNDTLALLFASAAACSVFVAAGIWIAGSPIGHAPSSIAKTLPSPDEGPGAEIENLILHLQNEPRDTEAMKRLGALYAETGHLKEAVSAYVSASLERPGDTEVRRALMELQARAQQKGKH